MSPCVLNKAKTYATRKYLLEIPVQMFPPLLVVDNITQSTPYVLSSNIDLENDRYSSLTVQIGTLAANKGSESQFEHLQNNWHSMQ